MSVKPLAAIILNWNGEALLRQFLPEVIANTNPALTRIIVADNGSTDGSRSLLRKEFADAVDIISFDTNLGFAAGYNRAIAEAGDHKYIALINSDLAPDRGWDTTLYSFLENNADVAAVQPKILSYKQPDIFEYAGACGGYIDCNGYPYCRGRIFGTCEADNGQYNDTADIFWASGAAFVVRRKAYIASGGLDTSFFAHMEEIDLCWRLHNAGWRIAVVPTASVRHLGGGSLPMGNPRKTYLNFRNCLLMMHKNIPVQQRHRFLLRRRLLDTIAWTKSFITGKWRDAAAIFRAHRDFRKMRTAYVTSPEKCLLGSFPGTHRNILTQYFLYRHHTFSTLDSEK